MLSAAMPASLKDICKGNQVGLHIIVGMVDAVAHPCLGREMNDPVETVLGETGFNLSAIWARSARRTSISVPSLGGLFQHAKACFLEARIVICINIIEANDRIAALQKSLGDMKADKACRARNQNFHLETAFNGVLASVTAWTAQIACASDKCTAVKACSHYLAQHNLTRQATRSRY